jgi:hypothetical protein
MGPTFRLMAGWRKSERTLTRPLLSDSSPLIGDAHASPRLLWAGALLALSSAVRIALDLVRRRPVRENYKNVIIRGGEGERRRVGGSCPNVNCLPSKNEIWSAKVADLVHHATRFGIPLGGASSDMAAVRNRKREMVEGLIATHLDRYKATGAELRVPFLVHSHSGISSTNRLPRFIKIVRTVLRLMHASVLV